MVHRQVAPAAAAHTAAAAVEAKEPVRGPKVWGGQ